MEHKPNLDAARATVCAHANRLVHSKVAVILADRAKYVSPTVLAEFKMAEQEFDGAVRTLANLLVLQTPEVEA